MISLYVCICRHLHYVYLAFSVISCIPVICDSDMMLEDGTPAKEANELTSLDGEVGYDSLWCRWKLGVNELQSCVVKKMLKGREHISLTYLHSSDVKEDLTPRKTSGAGEQKVLPLLTARNANLTHDSNNLRSGTHLVVAITWRSEPAEGNFDSFSCLTAFQINKINVS